MRKSIWLVSAGLAVIATPSFAQETTQESSSTTAEGPTEAAAVDQPSADTPAEQDSIIVTATRRNEALSDVPLAVSAVTANTMQNTGAVDIRGLNQVSPSLLVSSTSSEAGASVARIRGIGTVGDNAGLESSVGVFIDGVYRSRTGVGLTELGQIDRIEVLRGPQGTLFGRNTSAGLIHVITAKPRFTREIYGEATIGNYDLKRIELGATGPINDTLAARVDGIFMQRDGFLEDVIGGGDYNDRNRYMVRGQLLYQPNDDLSVRFIADYTKRNEQCCAAVYQPVEDKVALSSQDYLSQPSTIAFIMRNLHSNVDGSLGVIEDDPYDRKISLTPGRSFNADVEDYGASLEANYDFGGAELTSITAYRFNDYVRGLDADFNNLDILFRDGSDGSSNTFKTFTQELRLQGELWGGRLDWLIGGYYAHEKLKVIDNLAYGEDYEQFATCLTVANLASASGVSALLSPTSANCMNMTAAGAILASPTAPASLKSAVGLFGGLAPGLGGVGGYDAVGLAAGVGANPFDGVGLQDDFNQTSENFAIFTHNIFEITRGLKLTLGLRYTHESKDLDMRLVDNNDLCAAIGSNPLHPLFAFRQLACVLPSAPGGDYSADGNKSESKFSGTAVLSWKPIDSILAYASYSKGYKAGGFNLDRSALVRTGGTGAIVDNDSTRALRFDPELTDAYELGLKYDGPGIDINIALFREDFKDFQLNTFNGINFEVENINSCGALDVVNGDTDNNPATGACTGKIRSGVRSSGIEFELFYRPTSNLNLNFGMTYASTRYRNNLVGAIGEPISSQLFQLANRQISNASELVTTASLTWTPRIGITGLRGLFYIDGRQMSDFNTGSDLDIEKRQKGFGVVNGRIGVHGPDNRWGVEVWAQNLLDTKYKQVAFDMPLQGSCTERGAENGFCSPTPNRSTQLFGAFLGEPRTYGLTVRGKF
jgi:outer membrane receptor protein involved in Fe transport